MNVTVSVTCKLILHGMEGQCQFHEFRRRILAVEGQTGHLMTCIDVIKAKKRSEEGDAKDRVVLNEQLQLKQDLEKGQKSVEDVDERRVEVSRMKKEVGQREAEPNEISEIDERGAGWWVTEAELNRIYVRPNQREAELNELEILLNKKEAVLKIREEPDKKKKE
jgi:hypothetical protein